MWRCSTSAPRRLRPRCAGLPKPEVGPRHGRWTSAIKRRCATWWTTSPARSGRPQVLVNCAGVGQFDLSEDVALETWNRTIAVNLTGTFLMCQATLPYLLDGGGSIVNIASNSGLQGIPYAAAYAASKGGVILLTRSLASEYSGRGVRVNAVAPGGIVTPLLANFTFPPGADQTRMPRGSRVPHAHPDEIASLVAYIASDEARFMVGSVVSMDGGLTA